MGLCLIRPARGGARLPSPPVILLGALLALLVFSGMANHIDWTRRVGHVAILAGLVWAGGTGRLSLRSVGAGLATGLIAVIGLGVVGIGGGAYSGRLTGYLADPNAGAYFIAVLGTLAIFFCDERWKVRLAVAVPIVAGLGLAIPAPGCWRVPSCWSGSCSDDASALRAEPPWPGAWSGSSATSPTTSPPSAPSPTAPAATRYATGSSPRSGCGWPTHPGSATARAPGRSTSATSSSSSTTAISPLARRAAGPPCCSSWGSWSSRSCGSPTRPGGATWSRPALQAAIIGVAVMGVTLGEVLLDTPMAVAVALGLGRALHAPPDGPPDG